MVKDLNPLTTPNSVLTDVLNGTVITFNGNEFVLQNDMGNGIVERAKLSPGFLPLGMKEYGGIIYVASYNPDTQECEIGSFPSPERDITGSNKIEYQTGLRDANFLTGEYSTPTLQTNGVFNPTEVTIQLKKLNQQEILQLAPGDMYVTTFQVNNPGVAETNQVAVLNTTDFYEVFSVNNSNLKKTFSINFYKIDDSNNIKIIKDSFSLIAHTGVVEEDSFKYYTENNKGSIVVGVQLNGLLEYNAAIREISKRRDVIKKLRIEAVGVKDSDVRFMGSRVDIYKTNVISGLETVSFHIEKETELSDKISMDVTNLEELDFVTAYVTPYTQYGYLPSLTKRFQLQMGVSFGGQNVNDVFKWRVNSSTMELDFDFKFQTDNNLTVYLEFYDLWSNYSVITTYPSPSVYGPMRLNIPLIDEPATEIFNTVQTGGTLFTELADNLDTVHIPVMVNLPANSGSNLVRRNFELRKDHFYIVRICGIERVIENDILTNTIYNDVYKVIYTNTAFNDIYDAQNNVAFSDPGYVGDFNALPYPIEKITYGASLESGNLTTSKVLGSLPLEGIAIDELPTETVDGTRKLFAINRQPAYSTLIVEDTYYANQNHNISVTLANKNLIYGRLVPEIFGLVTPNNSTAITSDNIEENSIITGASTESAGTVIIPDITSEGVYTAVVEVSTKRKIKGAVVLDAKNVTRLNQSSTLDDKLYKSAISGKACNCGDDGLPSCQAGTQFSIYRTTYNGGNSKGGCESGKENWSLRLRIKNHVVDFDYIVYSGENLDNPINEDGGAFDHATLLDKQFFLASTGSYMEGMEKSSQLVFRARAAANPVDARIVVFATKSNSAGINNINLVSTILKQFAVFIVETSLNNNYYINANTLEYHENASTTFKNITVDLTSKFTVLSKTYIFDTKFKALGNTVTWSNLSTTAVNNYISSLNTGHIDLTTTIPDSGFIPFVTPANLYDKSISFTLPSINITKGVNNNLLTLFANSKNDYDVFLAELKSISDSFDSTRPVRAINTENQEFVNFAKMFRWVNNELNIDTGTVIEPTKAITRYAGASASYIRAYDKVIEPLLPL